MQEKSDSTVRISLDADNTPPLTAEQKTEPEKPAAMFESATDYSDIPPFRDYRGFSRVFAGRK